LSESSIQSTRRERRIREIAEPEKKDKQFDMLKRQVAELQKQLAELQAKDQTATLTKRVAELEAHLTEANSSAATAPAPNTALPRATTGATGQRPTKFIPPRDGTCWGSGDPGTGTGPARSSPTLRNAGFIVAESVGLTSAPVPTLTGLVKALDRLQRDTKKQLNLPVRALIESS